MGGTLAVIPKAERGPLGAVVRLRLDDSLRQRIKLVVAESGRSESDVMRLLMVAGLEQHERERGKAKR